MDANPCVIGAAPAGAKLNGFDFHGTCCAGAAAGDSALTRGTAPGATLMPVKIFRGPHMAADAQIADAIAYATDHGARVISCSWFSSPGQVHQAIRRATARGSIVVAAAGNDSANGIANPAALADCIAVGACTHDGQIAETGNFGAGICVYAPSRGNGRSIRTADGSGAIVGFKPVGVDPTDPAGLRHDGFGGTSAATAMVAGVVALMLAVDPALDAAGVRRILREEGDPLPGIGPGRLRVNAARAVTRAAGAA